ncbi:hypothetical protein [Dyadobacter sp. CY312]|uniref:hypothetical protein n=1 Tax=Dyadobacter sp. CY312 TaxID=2907303 RepID=UPI001F3D47B5|nr:hypothetical protein [Dyadobacter sp. CY312]MCE7039277.1 hypothetical protein [Dyadobacter sp. CY312]
MITKIDHEVRKALGISVIAYCVADYVHRSKLDTTAEGIAGYLELSILDTWEIIESLKPSKLIEIGQRSGKCSVTAKWKEAVKPAPKNKERAGDPLNHELRLMIEEIKPGYYWMGYTDYHHADLMLANLRHKFRIKYHREGSNEEILASVKRVLSSLPKLDFWKSVWDVKKLANNLDSIIGKIIELSEKESKGKIVESAQSIKQASSEFVPKTNF